MKKFAIFLFAFILVLSVNGNATDIVPIDPASLDNVSSVGEFHNNGANTISELKLGQSTRAVPEPIIILLLGFWLKIFGLIWRETLSLRCLTCPLT
jgi:uncharacterized membrane protein